MFHVYAIDDGEDMRAGGAGAFCLDPVVENEKRVPVHTYIHTINTRSFSMRVRGIYRS